MQNTWEQSISKFFVGFVLFISFISLGGCENTKTENWYEGYTLETDKITIYRGEKDAPCTTIEEKETINELLSLIDFSQWKPVSAKNQYKGEPYYFVDLNNGTAFSLYKDVSYGNVGQAVQKDDMNELWISESEGYSFGKR